MIALLFRIGRRVFAEAHVARGVDEVYARRMFGWVTESGSKT